MKSTNVVSYFCYGLAALSVIGVVAMRSGIMGSIFFILLSGFLYQTGTSFLKREGWAWWVSLALTSAFLIGSFISMYNLFVVTVADPAITGEDHYRWLSISCAVFSSYLVILLLQKKTRNDFLI